ncbi:hypothetical protein M406DRAFT_260927 [Cryphonectria parasitica EP155]|uniref:Uncharacterized protein n=1 Tax=Cryphonectria parasitica (strain ATCC 38755 / EP155) TaxID=660469 RepID=A0A9P4XZL1_CRYP1|nr:uncharacterized protein M406DRAFT_260927 [Cryphonectria parasitica EP155]KAF3763831.1 hypothetical protein M406DRAFT_260927 [Cryphonectria parasitica EP155]
MADYPGTRGGPAQTPNLLLRRIAAVALGIFLFSTASPFTPVSWLTQHDYVTYLDGPRMVDRVISPILTMGAAILHWYIASVASPLPLTLTVPNPGADVQVRDGQAHIVQNEIVLGLWLPSYFWPAMALEAALLWALRFGSFVVALWMERGILAGIIFSAWVVGWNAMPWYRKEQAWALIKDYVVRLIIMEMVDAAFGGGRNRRRRRM